MYRYGYRYRGFCWVFLVKLNVVFKIWEYVVGGWEFKVVIWEYDLVVRWVEFIGFGFSKRCSCCSG